METITKQYRYMNNITLNNKPKDNIINDRENTEVEHTTIFHKSTVISFRRSSLSWCFTLFNLLLESYSATCLLSPWRVQQSELTGAFHRTTFFNMEILQRFSIVTQRHLNGFTVLFRATKITLMGNQNNSNFSTFSENIHFPLKNSHHKQKEEKRKRKKWTKNNIDFPPFIIFNALSKHQVLLCFR